MAAKPKQPTLELRSANMDALTGRMLAGFQDAAGNSITVNAVLVTGGGDQGAATRGALVDILRQAADALAAVDAGE